MRHAIFHILLLITLGAAFSQKATASLSTRTFLRRNSDNNSNLLTVLQGGVTQTRTYDALNRVTSYNDGRGHTLGYGYDNNGNLTLADLRGGQDGHLHLRRAQPAHGHHRLDGAHHHAGAGRLLTLTRPNGTMRANTWDAASQLTAVMDKHTASGKPVLALKLGYDLTGRLTDKFEVPHIGANITLPVRSASYNLDNQIATQTIGGVARTITSDADGNITSAPGGLTARTRCKATAGTRATSSSRLHEAAQHPGQFAHALLAGRCALGFEPVAQAAGGGSP